MFAKLEETGQTTTIVGAQTSKPFDVTGFFNGKTLIGPRPHDEA
jgi:hypothetical protein